MSCNTKPMQNKYEIDQCNDKILCYVEGVVLHLKFQGLKKIKLFSRNN